MAEFNKAIDIILKHEGGFVDHPSDPGGATNKGITFNLFKLYSKALNLSPVVDSLKALTIDQAKFIYINEFWEPMQGDKFKDQQLANIVFDGFVNMGNKAIKILQKELKVYPDGKIGDESLRAINAGSPAELFNRYKEARTQFYLNLIKEKPSLEVFKKGWLNRINSFTYK